MATTIYTAIAAVLAGLVGSIGAYLAARRMTSGQITTSPPSELWAESRAMRQEMREELVATRKQGADYRRELEANRAELARSTAELEAARKQIEQLSAATRALGEEVENLRRELEASRLRLKEYEGGGQ